MSENEKKWLKHVYQQHEMMCKQPVTKEVEEAPVKIEGVYTTAPFGSANLE
jgi:hypothetical protein